MSSLTEEELKAISRANYLNEDELNALDKNIAAIHQKHDDLIARINKEEDEAHQAIAEEYKAINEALVREYAEKHKLWLMSLAQRQEEVCLSPA